MVTQHLLLRCKRGAFDTDRTAVTGFKTAAMSENAAALSRTNQFNNLLETVMQRGTLPDTLNLPHAASSNLQLRGILRISNTQGVSIVSRSFRVNDLCDNRGIVTFTHTYLLNQEDRTHFLQHPEVVLNLDNYDVYQRVAMRCQGGLISGNPVTVNESLNLFRDAQQSVSYQIFDYCGFSANTFPALITAVCDRAFTKGKVVLAMPKIVKEDWNQYGGSLLGEQLLSAIYSVLPECISEHLGSVSYWSGNYNHSGLDGIQLVIVPEARKEMYSDSSISLINLEDEAVTNVNRSRLMGKLLWNCIVRQQPLDEFYTYLSHTFGQNTHKLRKVSSTMDLMTNLYLQRKSNYKDDPERLVLAVAKVFGKYFSLFPEINEEYTNLLRREKQKESHSRELEGVLLEQVRMENAVDTPDYPESIYCMLQNVDYDKASTETIQTLTEKLQNGDTVVVNQVVQYLGDVMSRQNVHRSDALLKLVTSIYNGSSSADNGNVQAIAGQLLQNFYATLFNSQNWKRCLVIALIRAECLSDRGVSDQELQEIYAQLFFLYFVCDSETRSELTQLLSQEAECIFTRFPERTESFWRCFAYALEKEPNGFAEEMCPLYFRFLPLLFRKDDPKDQWAMGFQKLYGRFSPESWDRAEQSLVALKGGQSCSEELMFIEELKLRTGLYSPSGKEMLEKIDRFADRPIGERMNLLNEGVRGKKQARERQEFIDQLEGSLYYYAAYLSETAAGHVSPGTIQRIISRPNWWVELFQSAGQLLEGVKAVETALPTAYWQLLDAQISATQTQQVQPAQQNWTAELISTVDNHLQQLERTQLPHIPDVGAVLLPELRKNLEKRLENDRGKAEVIMLDERGLKILNGWYLKYQWQGGAANLIRFCTAVDRVSTWEDVEKLCRTMAGMPKDVQIAITLHRIEEGRLRKARSVIIQQEVNDQSKDTIRLYSALCILAAAIRFTQEQKDAAETYLRLCFGNFTADGGHQLIYLLMGMEFSEKLPREQWNGFRTAYQRTALKHYNQMMSTNPEVCLEEGVLDYYQHLDVESETKRQLRQCLGATANNTGSKKLIQAYFDSGVKGTVEFTLVRLLLSLLIYAGVLAVSLSAFALVKAVFALHALAGLVLSIGLFAVCLVADIILFVKLRE